MLAGIVIAISSTPGKQTQWWLRIGVIEICTKLD
jgi:hypothetical protein